MRAAFVLPALLLAVPVAREAQTPTPRETVIRGVVFDSLRMRPLANANVQIATATGPPWVKSYTTDSTGTFELTDVPNGTYLIGFFHVELDSLGLLPPTFRLDVRAGPPIHLPLAIPSARTIARSLCGRNGTTDSTGLFVGYVRGASNSRPLPDGKLVLRWAEIVIRKHSITREVRTTKASSGPDGFAVVCGLPLATSIQIQGANAGDSSGAFEITLPSTRIYHRDIFVAPLTRTSVATSDSTPVALLRGIGRVRGHVNGVTGRPVPGAHVTVWGTGIETVTSAAGEFTLGNLPEGTHTLEARAVGFAPARQPVDIVRGTPGAAEVELTNLAITLDTMKVFAQRVYPSPFSGDFERRRRMGGGRFFDEKDIEQRKPTLLTDLLHAIPGVRVVPTIWGGVEPVMSPGNCRPDLIIDGSRQIKDATFPLNTLVWANELRAVEVYTNPLTVPTEFQTVRGCGAIVVWTDITRR
jgi:carboxypeptidase family protein